MSKEEITTVSIVITTFNEGENLDSLLRDISKQEVDGLKVEIILLEAGSYSEERAIYHLGDLGKYLKFIHAPNLSRTKSLNKLFELSEGELIIRLDARSHIASDYINRIVELSSSTGSENVGGVMSPIGRTPDQQLIADIMRHPFSFGGAKFRNHSYSGLVDSVYLGAFRKSICKFGSNWFDEVHPGISEDSDLNYRIRRNGGKVYMDSSIIVQYFPRENLSKFFKLCFNFGVGRGLFLCKYRTLTATRQIFPIAVVFLMLFLGGFGFYHVVFHYILIGLFLIYGLLVGFFSLSLKKDLPFTIKAMIGFSGCHFFYSFGILLSPYYYIQNLRFAS